MIPPMRFDYMSWEAFATLVTGASAVGAAYLIGVRQTRITARQTDIVARQTDIQRLALNASLFQRRMEVVNAFAMHKNALAWEPENVDATREAFAKASNEVPFLFPSEVMDIIQEAWQLSTQLGGYLKAVRELQDHNREPFYDQFIKPASAEFQSVYERFFAVVAQHMTLHTLD